MNMDFEKQYRTKDAQNNLFKNVKPYYSKT